METCRKLHLRPVDNAVLGSALDTARKNLINIDLLDAVLGVVLDVQCDGSEAKSLAEHPANALL